MAQRCAVHTLGRSSIQYDALSNGHGTGKRLNCLWGLIKASNKWRILQSVPGREKKKKKKTKGCCNEKDNDCNDSDYDKAPPAQRTASDCLLQVYWREVGVEVTYVRKWGWNLSRIQFFWCL